MVVFSLLIASRRIFWLLMVIVIGAIIRQTVRRKAVDPFDWYAFFSVCAVEWYFREAFFNIMPIYNPCAYWWERRLVPIVLLSSLVLCAVINKIVYLGGPRKAGKRAAALFFENVSVYKTWIIKLDRISCSKGITTLLSFSCLWLAFAVGFTAVTPLTQGNTVWVCLCGIAFLLFETLRFACKAFCSVRKLLCFWFAGATVLGILAANAGAFLANSNGDGSLVSEWGTYALFTAIFIGWWVTTACMAEPEVVKVATSFTNTLAIIVMLGGNIFLVLIQEPLAAAMGKAPLTASVSDTITLILNMVLLPVLAAGLLAALVKKLQVSCTKKQSQKTAVSSQKPGATDGRTRTQNRFKRTGFCFARSLRQQRGLFLSTH